MADAGMIGAAISGVVSLMTAYMTYRVGMKTAENAAPPAKLPDDQAQKGESALNIVRTGVSQYGNDDEKADLANFERNPQRYGEALNRTLTDLAQRAPAFAQQLQTLAQQANIQTGGVRISGGKIVGNVLDTNPGTINSTYHINDRDDK